MTDQQSQHDDSAEPPRSTAQPKAAQEQPEDRSEPAEKEMAAHDILAAMAGGLELVREDESDNQPEVEIPEDLKDLAGPERPTVQESDLVGLPTGEGSLAARRARSATIAAQAGFVHGQQFKRAMIPALIVVGLLLFILGGIVAAMLPRLSSTARPGTLAACAWWAVPIAFPVGTILLFGAWFFHRELKSTAKR